MPKTEIDYSNTIIYKITCKDSNITDVYVGHTTNFVQRKHAHKQSCINNKSPNYTCKLYQVIRNNGGWNNWIMEIVNFFNCNDHYEARKKEQEYFEILHATLNSIEPMPKPKVKPEIIQNKIINKNNYGHYVCDICDYNTCRKSQYERHLMTSKHKMNTEGLQNGIQKVQKSSKNICECGKEYLHRQSLYKHKKNCNPIQENITITVEESHPGNNQYSTDLILEILKQNQEFRDLIIEQNKQMLEMNKANRQVTHDK